MRSTLLFAVLLLLPLQASAEVYMCVDPQTGATLFTDRACAPDDRREEVRVDAANLESGNRYAKQPKQKTWTSERDTRKNGREYNQLPGSVADNATAASALPTN